MVLIHCLSWKGEKFLAYTAIIYTSPIPFQNNLFYHTGKLYSGKPLAGPSTCHCNFLHFTSTLSVCGKDTKQASLPSQAVSGWPRFWTRGVSLDYFSTFLKYNKEKFHQRFSLRAVKSRLSPSSLPLLPESCGKQPARPVALSGLGVEILEQAALLCAHPLLQNYAREEWAPNLHTNKTLIWS